MQFPAVNWHEGLFLQPHHFQAWDRHWSERVSLGERWQSPYSYGLLELSINRDALAAGFLQVDVLRCKTPGGTLIDAVAGQYAERRDLRPAMELASQRVALRSLNRNPASISLSVDVYVGVPRLQLGIKNVDSPEHRNGARYVAQCIDLPDELDAACVRPVEVRNVNARLLVDGDDLAGYDLLRIARVSRSRQGENLFQLDNQYVPPLMDCSASDVLRAEVLTSLSDLLQHTSQKLTHQALDAGGELHASSPVDVRRLVALQALLPAASVFSVLAQSRGIHPMMAYTEMVRVAGSLAVLQPKRMPEPTAGYDHENIGPLFAALKRRITTALEVLRHESYTQAMFIGTEHGMQVSIEPQQLQSTRRWFIGVQRGNHSTESIVSLFQSGKLDFKLGGTNQIEKMFATRQAGLELRHTINAPVTLPQGDQWVYLEVINCESSAWHDVRTSTGLAMHINESHLTERSHLPGNTTINLKVGGKSFALQLALFGAA